MLEDVLAFTEEPPESDDEVAARALQLIHRCEDLTAVDVVLRLAGSAPAAQDEWRGAREALESNLEDVQDALNDALPMLLRAPQLADDARLAAIAVAEPASVCAALLDAASEG